MKIEAFSMRSKVGKVLEFRQPNSRNFETISGGVRTNVLLWSRFQVALAFTSTIHHDVGSPLSS